MISTVLVTDFENRDRPFGGAQGQREMSDTPRFSVGPLIAFDGGEGEALAASGGCIATLGAARATWWLDAIPHTLELPNIPVRGARWSNDRAAILAGPGSIDVISGTWSAHPAFAGVVSRSAPGRGGLVIQATSWSRDRSYAAVLLSWSGPRPPGNEVPAAEVAVLDLNGDATNAIRIPAGGASDVQIVGNKVVVAAPVVRVFSFSGAEIAALPATPGAPMALCGDDEFARLLVLDTDWSIRVIDTVGWVVQAKWFGMFRDAVAVPAGLIAVDHAGVLHAGCLEGGTVREVGTVATEIGAAQIAATGDGRLVMMGAGPVAVHAMSFEMSCK